jgi:hypothetical protein
MGRSHSFAASTASSLVRAVDAVAELVRDLLDAAPTLRLRQLRTVEPAT